MPDFGVVCYAEHEGKKTLGMKVTWNKRYITLSPIACFSLLNQENFI